MIYLPLLSRPEILHGNYSFEVLQCYALPCPRVTHTGLQMHSHFKTPQRTENSSYLGFGRGHCTYEMSFRPSQRIICFAHLFTVVCKNIRIISLTLLR